MDTNHGLRIIYLGKRGGGLALLKETCSGLLENNIPFELVISSTLEDQLLELPNKINIYRFFSPSKLKDFTYIFGKKNKDKKLNLFFNLRNNKINFFIMPSPFDYVIFCVLRILRQHIVTCIHDATRHPGDFWPWKRSISYRARISSQLICFSEHVASRIKNPKNLEITICDLPSKVHNDGRISSDVINLFDALQINKLPNVLFIGRIRKYKSIEDIKKVSIILFNQFNFVIAGEGKLSMDKIKYIYYLNRWLSDYEFNSFIEFADIIILPYSEASQSGIIPLAVDKNKWIIATRLPGLVEQLGDYKKSFFYDEGNIEQLHRILLNILENMGYLKGSTKTMSMSKNPKKKSKLFESAVNISYRLEKC